MRLDLKAIVSTGQGRGEVETARQDGGGLAKKVCCRRGVSWWGGGIANGHPQKPGAKEQRGIPRSPLPLGDAAPFAAYHFSESRPFRRAPLVSAPPWACRGDR